MRKCNHKGCDKPHHAKGYCMRHYVQLRNNGYLLDKESMGDTAFLELVTQNMKKKEIPVLTQKEINQRFWRARKVNALRRKTLDKWLEWKAYTDALRAAGEKPGQEEKYKWL